MKKCAWALFLLLFLLTPLLSACGEEGETDLYAVYYRSQDTSQPALAAEERQLSGETGAVEGLLTLLLTDPQEEGHVRVIPQGVKLQNWSLQEGLLTVDFSAGYAALSGINLTLADYSVVLTLTQLEEVEAVTITAGGEPLPYRGEHQVLTAEDVWLEG